MELKTIDGHLKSCSPYDVYTYSFNKSEVEYINSALQKCDLVKEISKLVKEENMEYKTVTAMIESIASEFCDGYCKYASAPVPEGKTEDWLIDDESSPCNNCPINRL